jgi:hypothetical protein
MTDQLPAHLVARQRPAMLHDAVAGLSRGRGPYISTESNRFTLIDGSGNEKPVPTFYLDVVVVDVNPHTSRIYYDPSKPYKSGEAQSPLCFSDNGVGPSQQAQQPQSNICLLCPKADWSSAVAVSGGTKPACANGKKLAVIAGETGELVFEFRVPPKSLKPWLAYCDILAQRGLEPYDVYTRVEFASQGVLKFSPAPIGDKGLCYVHEPVVTLTEKLWAAKATELATNKNDVPWGGQAASLPVPGSADAQKIAYAQTAQHAVNALPAQPMAPPPQPFGGQGFPGQPGAGNMQEVQRAAQPPATGPFGQGQAAQAAPPGTSSQTEQTPPRRTRGPNKPKADPPSPSGFGATSPAAPVDDGIPPFLRRDPPQPVAPPPVNPTQFGMQANPPAPDAGVKAALDAAFRLTT